MTAKGSSIKAHRNTESIDLRFQFLKFRLVTTQAFVQGAKSKKLSILIIQL